MRAATKAGIGAGLWIGWVAGRVTDLRGDAWAHALLLFAALVLVPLVFALLADDPDDAAPEKARAARLLALAERGQLAAAVALAVACWLPAGVPAALCALPWIALCGALAAAGVLRAKRGGLKRELHLLAADAALVFAGIGGAWTLADRLGWQPLGFPPAIVTLTAVHFHYAGLLLPLCAGLVQRELWMSRLASRAVVGSVLGVPAVAAGITASQLGWKPAWEAAAGCGLALAGMTVAVLHVRLALDAKWPAAARLLLGVAGASLFFGMVLAALYASRAFSAPAPWLDLPQMRALHGTVNAGGFALCAVLGWRAVQTAANARKSR